MVLYTSWKNVTLRTKMVSIGIVYL